MRKPNPGTIKKIATFMKDIYDELQNGKQITFKEITKKHHISTRVSSAMIELGIIERISWGRGGVKYKWMVNEPNLKLAENVARKANSMKKNEVKKEFNPFKEYANRESEESFNKRKELARPIVDDVVDNFLYSQIIQEIVDKAVQKALTPPVKIRKVLKLRNPFYWVEK